MKKNITMRALIQRINRVLIKDYEVLHKSRDNSKWFTDMGDYYIVDENKNTITASHINPVKLGKELGVIKPYETVKE